MASVPGLKPGLWIAVPSLKPGLWETVSGLKPGLWEMVPNSVLKNNMQQLYAT